MGSVSVKDARNDLAEILNKAAYGKERIFLTRHGKNVAAIVPIEDVALLEFVEDRIDVAEAMKALAEPGPNVPWKELKAQLAGARTTRKVPPGRKQSK